MNNQQKLIILAAVAGLSAVGLLILLRRRHQDDESFGGNGGGISEKEEDLQEFADLTASQAVASAAETIVRVNVPQYCVGVIIGKGGEKIRQLKKETGARLDFEKDEKGEKKDRILEIRGNRENVHNAEMTINQLISEIPKVIEIEILVPQEACGRIIGRGGEMIKDISSASGARIKVDSNSDRSVKGMSRVHFKGTSEQVAYAKGLVEEQVELAKEWKKGKSSKREVKKRSPSPATRPKFPVSKIPLTDDFFQIFVSAFDIPSHFYIQLVTKESSKLDELTKEMTDYYGNPELSQNEKPPTAVFVGDIYCAPFDLDELWYRANVIEVKEEEKVAVLFYIDYGDTGTVPFDDLRKPKAEYLQLEAQAIECFLANVQPKDGKWSDESIDRFEGLSHCAKWSELMAHVVKYEEIDNEQLPCLELIDTKEEVEINIAQVLVKEGYAIQSSFATASNESELEVIQEDVITKASNNNFVDMMSSNPNEADNKLTTSTENGEISKIVENENEVIQPHFINEDITTENVVFEEGSFLDIGSLPELVSFPENGSSPSKGVSPGADSLLEQQETIGEPRGITAEQFEGSYDHSQSNRSSASISSDTTEDTVIHVAGKPHIETKGAEVSEITNVLALEVVKEPSGAEEAQESNDKVQSSPPAEILDSEVKGESLPSTVVIDNDENVPNEANTEVIGQADGFDANDSGVDLETMNFDPNFKKSVTEEVSRWMERSYEENAPLETIPEDLAIDTSDRAVTSSLTSSVASSVEVENGPGELAGQPRQWKFQESLELAKENPVILSDDEDSMSYFSARSEQTIASDNDTLSFKSAPDTPTNMNEFQFPSKDDSSFDYDIITTPVGSDDESLIPDIDATPVGVKSTPVAAKSASSKSSVSMSAQTPTYQIKFIDESGKQSPKVASASMENVSSADNSRLSSSPQRISKLSASTPQFGGLQTSQSRFGGSGSLIGKETSI